MSFWMKQACEIDNASFYKLSSSREKERQGFISKHMRSADLQLVLWKCCALGFTIFCLVSLEMSQTNSI